MIEFKELKISLDGKKLIIDASVIDSQYYNDVYIDTVIIDTQDTYTPTGPSSKPIFTHSVENEKSVRLELETTELNVPVDNTLFFVYIIAKGTPSIDTPCNMDNKTTLGVISYLYPFYNSIMYYIKEVENKCKIPKNFINFILRLKAFELSIKTGHYTKSIEYWNRFFKNIKNNNINTDCLCHG